MIERYIKKSTKVTFGGITAALSVIVMVLSGLIYGTEYALPLFAGLLLIPISKELGKGWAFLTYIAVTILSFLLIIRIEPPVVYASFLGYYPILKEPLEKIKYKWLSYILKYGLFNLSVAFVIWITPILAKLLGLPTDNLTFLDKFPIYIVIAIVVIIANGFFFLYDLCLNRAIDMYMDRLHRIFSKFIRR
jgi:hypothetical protein